jgi:hypothetical protein
MAWTALCWILAVFTVLLAVIVYSLFSGRGEAWFKAVMAVLDGILGLCLRRVYAYLFPPICRDRDGTVKPKP